MKSFLISALFAKETKSGVIFFPSPLGLVTLFFILLVFLMSFSHGIDIFLANYTVSILLLIILRVIDLIFTFVCLIFFIRKMTTFVFSDSPMRSIIDLILNYINNGKSNFTTKYIERLFTLYFFEFVLKTGKLPSEIKSFRDIRKLSKEQFDAANKITSALINAILNNPSLSEKTVLDFFDMKFTDQEKAMLGIMHIDTL